MPEQSIWLTLLGSVVVLSPVILVLVLGIPSLLDRNLSERRTVLAVFLSNSIGLLAAIAVLGLMLAWDTRHVVIGFGQWVHIGQSGPNPHYHFSLEFVFDRLSVPFVILSLALCGTIGAFADRYMHREEGFNRFFVLYSLFTAGIVLAALAGTIETLFTGWELVGLSSAVLVGFFHERRAPVENGLRVWIVYRISDAALLLAAIVLHHTYGEGSLDKLTGYAEVPGISPLETPSWPYGTCSLAPNQALVVGILLIIAAAGKSALIPFSGWLPRAMEGPTPSSAVFYGALSVHLGVFLLLRISPILDSQPILAWTVVALGLSTAAFAALTGRVQTDVKSALSFASLTQVGLIVAEIGLGWRYIPLIHLLGHACLRTLQFVRAPSLLRDRRFVEDALGDRPAPPGDPLGRLSSQGVRVWMYRFALERGYLDGILADYVVGPFVRLFRFLDRLDRRATEVLGGRTPQMPAEPRPQPSEVEQPV